jgi:cytochrome c oxidase cbb3-type subunit 1
MNATSPTPQLASTGGSRVSTAEIDASCRVPLFVLFVGAAFWLVIASAFALMASIKFHSPDFLARGEWLTYGRVRAAASSAQLYGFALPAGFGVALWILARLGGSRVSQPWIIGVGGKIWNLGVLVGVAGILAGDSTGFENLEMPRYAAVLLFLGYLMVGLWTALTLHDRRGGRLAPSAWFLIAALFWFPWIYSTANLLLVVCPARGMMQAVIAWWFSNNLTFVWLALAGLAAFFYFIPEFSGRALHSEHLAAFTFWTLLLFASWCGIPAGAPVPAWMPVVSSIATVLTAVTLISLGLNIYETKRGAQSKSAAPDFAPAFIYFGLGMFQLAGLARILGAFPEVGLVTRFTWFTVAQSQLNLYGFFTMTMFGAIYYIVPRVAGIEWPCAGSVRWHFRLAALGLVLFVFPLAAGGVAQGLKLNSPLAFADVTKATLPFLRASTLGDLLMAVGHLLLVANLIRLAVRYGRIHFVPLCKSATAELKPAEVKP